MQTLLLFLLTACTGKTAPDTGTANDTAPADSGTASDGADDTAADPAGDGDTDTSAADTDVPAPPQNLLGNASFEDSPLDRWEIWPATLTNFAVLPASDAGLTAHEGAAVLKVWGQGTGAANETPVYQAVAAAEGDNFKLTGWAWMPSSAPFVASHTYAVLSVKYFGAAWTWLGASESVRVTNTSATDTWIPLTASGTAPVGTTEIQASVVVWQCANIVAPATCTDGTGEVYFDDLELERG
jgi:hypothetical protein